jgi:flagellin-like protein
VKSQLAGPDDSAASPVIGIILLVGVVVILAFTFVPLALSYTENTDASKPIADFDFEYNNETGNVTVTHASGDTLRNSRVRFVGTASTAYGKTGLGSGSNNEITAGNSVVLPDYKIDQGETIRVVWKETNKESTVILDEFEVPNTGGKPPITTLIGFSSNNTAKVVIADPEFEDGKGYLVVSENCGGSADTDNDGVCPVSATVNGPSTKFLNFDSNVGSGDTVTARLYETSAENELITSKSVKAR